MCVCVCEWELLQVRSEVCDCSIWFGQEESLHHFYFILDNTGGIDKNVCVMYLVNGVLKKLYLSLNM